MRIHKLQLLIRYTQTLTISAQNNWVERYLNYNQEFEDTFIALSKQVEGTKRYKFGVEVPKTQRQALVMDSKNGNPSWEKSIQLELHQIMSYRVVIIWPNQKPPPPG